MVATFAGGLSACATAPPVTSTGSDTGPLSGRMSVRIDATAAAPARSVSVAFELTGNAQQGRLDLNTPLGTTLARAHWQPGSVAVSSPQGNSSYVDLPAMSRALLGEDLPVIALFDRLRGRPWSGALSELGEASAAKFSQLGWEVDLAGFSERWVNARRVQPPAVTVRVKLDAP